LFFGAGAALASTGLRPCALASSSVSKTVWSMPPMLTTYSFTIQPFRLLDGPGAGMGDQRPVSQEVDQRADSVTFTVAAGIRFARATLSSMRVVIKLFVKSSECELVDSTRTPPLR